jgi:hypothetical protein
MPVHVRRGLIASAFTVALALILCSLAPPPIFLGWVAYLCVAPVPMMLVAGFLWRAEPPAWLKSLRQPRRGLVLTGITLLSAGPAALFLYWVPGGGLGATPTVVKASITCVVAAFWLIVAWRCWPLSLVIKEPTRLGIAAWIGSFALGEAIFWPPALVFLVTTSAVISAWAKCFGIRFNIVLTSLGVLLLSAAWMGIGVALVGMDEVDFMVRWPVSLIFGLFLSINMTRYRLFADLTQPTRGFCLLAMAMSIGALMYQLFDLLAPGSGHPHELWIATALLSVTFPLIIIVANYFELWPLGTKED